MTSTPIDGYGLVGDLHTAALVSRAGSIDWLCVPAFDSPSVFAALLDAERGGRLSIRPELPGLVCRQFYVPDTNVLTTRFVSPACLAELVDFMPVSHARHAKATRPGLVRTLRVEHGAATFQVQCRPAFDYARARHEVKVEDRRVVFDAGPHGRLTLSSTHPLRAGRDGEASARIALEAGETLVLSLDWGDEPDQQWHHVDEAEATDLLTDTLGYWRDWISRCTYRGRWDDRVRRSALCLKLLTYEPTGAIVAAPTCSLPEHLGGRRNWDYRYTWLRDASFTVRSLLQIGLSDEATSFMRWLEERCHELEPGRMLLPLYGIDGRHELPEEELTHLAGYRGSRPVRIGNRAVDQLQLDVVGTVLDAADFLDRRAARLSHRLWGELRQALDWQARHWDQPDNGPWEVRGPRQRFTYSAVMSWVAFDRGLRLARRRGLPGNVNLWRRTRDRILEAVMARGWSEERGAFVQAFDGDTLDASCLAFPIVGFVAADDPRMCSTLHALDRPLQQGGLVSDHLVHRYRPSATDDGLNEPEGAFNATTFWLVQALTLAGRNDPRLLDRARLLWDRLLAQSNALGLWAEQTNLEDEGALGNYPQGLTHLSFISAACALDRALGAAPHRRRPREEPS